MAGLKRTPHDVHVTSAVKGVVTTAVGHLDELFLDALSVLETLWVHKVGCAKFVCPLLLAVIDVNDDDLASALLDTALNDTQTDAASTKDGNVGAFFDTALAGSDDCSSVSSSDTTTEQAGAVHWCLVGNRDNRNVCDNGVLREGGSAHEVEEVLALALEARASIWHDTLALGGSDLAAEVGLARLAELALLALWGAIRRSI